MKELQQRGVPYNFIISGQHQETMDSLRYNFGLKEPDVVLYRGPDIVSVGQMIIWSIKIIIKCLKNKSEIFQNDKIGIVINHGDTFTTLLGAIMARIAGLKNGHLESGLRSFNFFHPFPEELTRWLVFHMTDYYFCPGDWALNNLKKYKGKKINTHYNTLYDSVRLALKADADEVSLPKEKFAIVSVHRYENVFRAKRLEYILTRLERVSQKIKLIFILHPSTKNQLKKFNFYDKLENNNNIELRPRYDYFRFIKLLNKAEFIITDGGSNQEESFYLGKPCLLMRKKTERTEGLSKNVLISNYDDNLIDGFVGNYKKYKNGPEVGDVVPSKIVADFLQNWF